MPDASAAVEYFLWTPAGRHVARLFRGAELVAPELIDAEVLSVVRRFVLAGRLPATRGRAAVEDLGLWPCHRVPHRPLLLAAFELRENVSAYDALYVAVAMGTEGSIVTADGPLARAPLPGITVLDVGASGTADP